MNAFVVRTQVMIRQTILNDWASRYRAFDKQLDTEPDSDPFNQASAFSLPLEGIELRALAMTKEIFPDTASEPFLLRHAATIGMIRKPATAARLSVTVTGTPSTTSPVGSRTVNAPDGTKYVPVDTSNVPLANITLDGSGNATILVKAQTNGTIGNRSVGAILTWSTAPTGFNSTATVLQTETTAASQESLEQLASRIIDWWRERPSGGNRAYWVDIARRVPEVQEAYAYPLLHHSLGGEIAGSLTLVVMGAPGNRILPEGSVQKVRDIIFGTATTEPEIPANVIPSDWRVMAPMTLSIDVTTQIALSGMSFPFAGSYAVKASPAPTATQFDTTVALAVDVGYPDLIAVETPAGKNRGRYAIGKIASASGSTITLESPLKADDGTDVIPVAGAEILPAPPNWAAMRDAQIAVFDRAGPGDVNLNLYPDSARWPKSVDKGPYNFYKAAMIGSVMGVPGLPGSPKGVTGVVNANVSSPAADQTPDPLTVIVPGKLRFVVMP